MLELAAAILVPLIAGESFLGVLIVSVLERPQRLRLTHDQLTGLANRLQFTERLRSAIDRARDERQSVTLLYMDLDRFKPVNDEFGHDVGDQLLVALAKRLAGCTRSEDMVARLGRDEFAVLIDWQTTAADAEGVSERLAAALTNPFVIEGHVLRVGASIGQAVFPIDADDADGLLRSADGAMFRVKKGAHPPPPATALGR
ncbi:MAG: diguanylate cyclase domain-containing protein [Solirubrobacteraceae bacterium]